MKKTILLLASAIAFIGCNEETLQLEQESINNAGISLNKSRKCHANENFEKMLLNEEFRNNVAQIESQTNVFVNDLQYKKGKPGSGGGGEVPVDNLGVLNIPVLVHVIYNSNAENISDAQIQSQIDVLNKDFRKTNVDVGQAPSIFAGLAADSEITFTLAGIDRKFSTRTSWGTNDAMKSLASGGTAVVDPANFLNIWVCNIGGGILGYAQFPGGAAATDGIVIAPQYFGNIGTATAPFDKGRTATHEVGHYLNLRHIWGDGRCNADDFVSDTPTSDRANYGCPSFPTTNCRSTDMTMNYMDYVDDSCMYMFSSGQKARMRSLFAPGAVRSALVN
jgi:hypothetical protein